MLWIFFILSGFVVSNAYEARLKNNEKTVYFLRKRVIRLYPLIVVGMLLGFIRFSILNYQQVGSFFSLNMLIDLVCGLVLVPVGFERGAALSPLNGPLWSLHFEFIAYLFFWLVLYKISTKYLSYIIFTGAVGVFIWCRSIFGEEAGGVEFLSDIFGYFFGFFRVVFSFALGVLIFRYSENIEYIKKVKAPFLVLLLVVPMIFPRENVYPIVAFMLIAVAFPYIVLAATAVRLSMKSEVVSVFLGNLSFPLYVLHVPLMWTMNGFMKSKNIGFNNPVFNGFIILPVVICISYLAFVVLDRPLRSWLSRKFC